uniref:Immunoglobulin domain-containing protein n=1 Tax=Pygocentrus nattereri TaxID=42514 RepID=A0A3B4EHL9_PYGNA
MMALHRIGLIIFYLYKISVRNSEPLVVSAAPGETVTLNYDSSAGVGIWYKQRLENVPLEVASIFKDRKPVMSPHFKQTRFKIDRIANGISLRIEAVTKEDEGMYFCGLGRQNGMDFSSATFLAVTGDIIDSLLSVLFIKEIDSALELYRHTFCHRCGLQKNMTEAGVVIHIVRL